MTQHKRVMLGFVLPVLALIVLLAVGADAWRVLLRFDRAALSDGELWRLATGHLVHLSWSHTLLNGAGLVLVALLFAARTPLRAWYLAFVLALLAIDAGLWWWRPSIGWYVGLSGILHGLFVLGAWYEWRDGQRSGLYLLLAIAAKLIYEQAAGALPMTASAAGGPVVVDAHLLGALGGALACGLMRATGGATRRPDS